jgi:hypothetical protein
MKPYQVAFYVYAEDESEVKELQRELNNFVRDRYNKGVLVTSRKLVSALKKFGNNFIVNNFLAK